MNIHEVYKIGCAEYTFDGSIFERMIDGAAHLELDKIYVLRDSLTNFFEIPTHWDDYLEMSTDTIIELLDNIAGKYIEEIALVTDTIVAFGGSRKVAQKIKLEQLNRIHTAVLLYEQTETGYRPLRLYIFYIVETFVFENALVHQVQEAFPYKEKDVSKND